MKNTKRFSSQTIKLSLQQLSLLTFSISSVLLLMVFLLAKDVLARVRIDERGGLIFSGQILSEESDDRDEGKSGKSEESSSASTSKNEQRYDDRSESAEDEKDDSDKSEREKEKSIIRKGGMRIQTEKENGETRTEIRFGPGEQIQTRTDEEGRTRTEVTSGGVKVRLQREGDRIKLKTEQEDGEEVELGEEESVTIEERLEKRQIRVRPVSGERMIIQRGRSTAVTKFPLSIDLETNELVVTTPAGEKRVAVLPDQAIQNMLAANVVDRIGGQTVAEQVAQELAASVTDVVALAERNGVPIYEVAGFSDQRLLGFIPVSIPKTAVVSAESGELLSTEQSLLNRLLDVFSL